MSAAYYAQVGLPSIAKRFRGKPLLVYGKESSVTRGPGFAELDLNAHAFSYVGRKVTFGRSFSSFVIYIYIYILAVSIPMYIYWHGSSSFTVEHTASKIAHTPSA